MDEIAALVARLKAEQGLAANSDGNPSGPPSSSPTPTPASPPQAPAVSAKGLRKRFRAWAADGKAVREHMAGLRLPELVGRKRRGALVVVRNVLPEDVAEGALSYLRQLGREDWEVSTAGGDTGRAEYGAGSTRHRFRATTAAATQNAKAGKALSGLLRALGCLCPEDGSEFQLGRYGAGDHIETHDDAAYTDARVPGRPGLTLCSRDIAVILYLTKEWREEFGGCFVDHGVEGSRTIVPEFNSLVAFRVPRPHEVTALTTKQPRYSVFGWTLKPGKLYKLKLKPARSPGHTTASTTRPRITAKAAKPKERKRKAGRDNLLVGSDRAGSGTTKRLRAEAQRP